MRLTLNASCLILSTAALLIFNFTPIYGQEGYPRIITLSGRADIFQKASKRWVQAEKGMVINKGDVLRTSERAYAEVAFDENLQKVMKIDEKTEVRFERMRPFFLDLPIGRVFSLIEGLEEGSTFEVRTSAATIGVSGTGYGAETDGKRTTVYVFEKEVTVTDAAGDARAVGAGWKGSIDRFQKVADMRFGKVSRRERNEWRSWERGVDRMRERARTPREAEKIERIDRVQERLEEKTERIGERREAIGVEERRLEKIEHLR